MEISMSKLTLCVALAIFLAGSLVHAQAPTELKGHTEKVHGLAFSPDDKLLATAGFDNNVKIWEFGSTKEPRTLTGHTGPVYSVAFNNDGTMLASASHDGTIRLWNVA